MTSSFENIGYLDSLGAAEVIIELEQLLPKMTIKEAHAFCMIDKRSTCFLYDIVDTFNYLCTMINIFELKK